MIGLGPALGQSLWCDKLRRTLARRRGARLGEATMISRFMHVGDPREPETVVVLLSVDAGEAMYNWERPGEVIHIDIFHELADVDHRRVSAAMLRALGHIPSGGGLGRDPARPLLDYFDFVTGTGGGRVTGTLNYAKKASVRVAHRNHVHVAGLLSQEQLEYLVPLVGAVEEELRAQGVEIRRIERIHHLRDTGGGVPLDLSHYTDQMDSLLKGNRPSSKVRRDGQPLPGSPSGEGGAGGAGTGSLRSGRGAAGGGAGAGGLGGGAGGGSEAGYDLPSADGAGAASSSPVPRDGEQHPASGSGGSGWDELEQEKRLQAALDLSRRLGSPDEVRRVLHQLQGDQGWASLYGSGSSQAPFVIRQLEDEGLVRREIRGIRLTEAGQELARYMEKHLRDVKLRFRKLIRRMPASTRKSVQKPTAATAPPSAEVRYGPIRGSAPAEPGAWLSDIAVPETVRSALRRTYLARAAEGAPGGQRPGLRLTRDDVHVHLRSGDHPLNICLLIDASASMAGRRILAAKHLARHLLVSTRDRVAVIAFQERDVRVYVPFTRDWSQVEHGLARIQPLGLTPLAHGLTQSMDLIRESRVRRPLLLLITDGIPTVPKWTIDPLSDALEAARMVGGARIPFGCIGLQPSRRYLEELVRAAGGTLHVVEELDEDVLVSIAHQERLRTAQKAR